MISTDQETRRRGAADALSPPGPQGLPLVGQTLQLARDPLGFPLRCARDYGGVVRLRVRGLEVILVADPAAIEEILVTRHDSFVLDSLSRRLGEVLGNSVIVSEGETWRERRRMIGRALVSQRVAGYVDVIADVAQEVVGRWRRNERFDAGREMGDLMLTVIAQTLMAHDLRDSVTTVRHSLDVLMRCVLGVGNTGLRLPLRVPTPHNVAARKATRRLDELVDSIIVNAHATRDHNNVVSSLIRGTSSSTPLKKRDLRDEILTLLLVGHETSALALTYILWLLATHERVQRRASSEVDDVLEGAPPTADRLPRLGYVRHVVHEALRLFPPVWAMGREALHDCPVGPYRVAAGSQMLISPWVNHRNSSFFADPETFAPERWRARSGKVAPYTYLPFGAGPRMCPGHRFAMTEILVTVAVILQRYRLEAAAPPSDFHLRPSVTLRPAKPVYVVPVAR